MSKSDLVHVGTFGAVIGLKGEIKINLLTTSVDVFKSLGHYYNSDQSIEWKFNSIGKRKNKCIAHPSHCNSCEEAEELKNMKIFSLRENFPHTKANEYYVSDLVKCKIEHQNGEIIGKVISVDNFGAGDLIETIYKDKKIYIPMNNDNVISIDIDAKKIIINPIKGVIDNA